jgi:hypothetical protein
MNESIPSSKTIDAAEWRGVVAWEEDEALCLKK